MNQPSVADMLRVRRQLVRKAGFVPSQMGAGDPAAAGMPPGGAPGGMPPGGAPGGMPPGDPSAMGGAPPMDPMAMGGAPPMDPSMMGGDPAAGGAPLIAPDGTSPTPPDAGGSGGAGKGAGKASQEDILKLQQQVTQVLSELRLQRDLFLDMMTQMKMSVNPETLRSSVASADGIINQQDPAQAGGM